MRSGTPIEKTLRDALAPSEGCATIEELGRLAERGPAAEPRLAEHAAGCVRCRTELDLLAEFEAAAPRPEEELSARWITARLENDVARMTRPAAAEPARSPASRRAAGTWLPRTAVRAAAAALAIAAALVLVVNLQGREAPPELSPDAASSPGVLRSSAVTLVAPVDDVASAPGELRWEPVPGAASYAVTLTEVDRTEVWSAEVRSPSAPLPPAVRARMVPGKPFLWRVAAKDAAGAVVATSGVQRFRVPLPRRGDAP
jgi:hypothetical protein